MGQQLPGKHTPLSVPAAGTLPQTEARSRSTPRWPLRSSGKRPGSTEGGEAPQSGSLPKGTQVRFVCEITASCSQGSAEPGGLAQIPALPSPEASLFAALDLTQLPHLTEE